MKDTFEEKASELWQSYALPNDEDYKLSEVDALNAFKARIATALRETYDWAIEKAATAALSIDWPAEITASTEAATVIRSTCQAAHDAVLELKVGGK